MDSINRLALVVTPKQPYFDWAIALDDDDGLVETTKNNPTVYLVYAIDGHDSLEDLLEMYFEEIFEEQLNCWWRDRSKWPENRTVEMFQDWFSASVAEMVYDLEDGVIEHD